MASTSSSIAASSSKQWEYDVFLSFRGEDTCNTFVGHLYSAFVRHGIHTYKDNEELGHGDSIAPSLQNAIQESQSAVIVFSENYANSSWCLDELAYIMQCQKERGQKVFPIFYKVDPSDVGRQKGKFGEAFAKYESENNNKVESWRKALVDAANLSGWETKYVTDGSEAKWIEEIAVKVSHILLPSFSSVDEGLIGIETRMKILISQLDIGSGGVRMVGIWGVGGGGKTTLAYSVYSRISCEFDGCSFRENVRENSRDLTKLQEKVISDVLKGKRINVDHTRIGEHMIKSRLRHKRVLIVLDDVDNHDQLEALVGSHDWFGEGSRIIITTRDEHLLKRVDVIHGVHLLNDHEASQLLRTPAYCEDKPVEDYESLSQKVVSYAGGLPLALKVLGSVLYDKGKNGRKSALAKLEDILIPTIFKRLKISYDGLPLMGKELFLHITCFFRGHKIDEVMPILDALGRFPHIRVKMLIQKSLITISKGSFDMHNFVQQMGHYIVREESRNNPENLSRVWRKEDAVDLLSGDAMKENYKIVAFHYPGEDVEAFDSEVNIGLLYFSEFVSNMKKLRYLKVECFVDNAPGFLSNELRWIEWRGYPGSSLPIDFQPTRIAALILERSLLKQLWMGCKHLPRLKHLDLSYSENLTTTPDFSGLLSLERLILRGCSSLDHIHPSIGYLRSLILLDMDHCEKIKFFPTIVRFERLETFILSSCSRLRNFPEIQGDMNSLKHLDLHESGIEVLPLSFGQYCIHLVSVNLSYCSRLKRIEGNFHLLKHLKVLYMHGCTQLEKPPEDILDVQCRVDDLSLPPMNHSSSSSLSVFLKKVDLSRYLKIIGTLFILGCIKIVVTIFF